MDIVQQCLSLAPVPYLGLAFSVFRSIWSSVQQVQASKEQLRVLAISIAQLLKTLDAEYHSRKLTEAQTSAPLADLRRYDDNFCYIFLTYNYSFLSLLEEISAFVQKQSSYGFLKLLIVKDQRIVAIEGYHHRIEVSANAFQVCLNEANDSCHTINSPTPDFVSFEYSRLAVAKRSGSYCRSASLVRSSRWFGSQPTSTHWSTWWVIFAKTMCVQDRPKAFFLLMPDAHQSNAMAMMASLQRHIDEHIGGDRERQFFSHSLRYLSTNSGQQVELKPWMVTSFDVEFGPLIGSGGL